MRTLQTMMWAGAWAALLALTPGVLLAQGTSPWVDAVNELQTQFRGPIARGLSLIAIVDAVSPRYQPDEIGHVPTDKEGRSCSPS